MKIFSSFDTMFKLHELNESQSLYGKENSLLVCRSKLYYRIFFLTPIVMVFMAILLGIFIVTTYLSGKNQQYGIVIIILIGLAIIGIIRYRSYLYYYLDFVIITPEKIDIYDQRDLIHRNIKSLFTHEIKGIYIDKGGFRNSVFNQGNITIESYTDEHAELFFGPVSKPDEVKKQIEYILNKH